MSSFTLARLGIFDPNGDRRRVLCSPLTEPPRHFGANVIFFPCGKNTLDALSGLSKEDLALRKESFAIAKREMYTHIYQGLCSLMLAILNIDNVRRINAATAIAEAGYTEYQVNLERIELKYREHSRNTEFEEAVKKAQTIRDKSNDLIQRLLDLPDDLSLCRVLAAECKSFLDLISDLGTRYVDSKELLANRPNFTVDISTTRYSLNLDSLIQILSEGHLGASSIDDLRIHETSIADVEIRLEPSSRSSTFFGPFIPANVPYEIDPVGFYVRPKKESTYFATLFQSLEDGLRRKFEVTQETAQDGRSIHVFCPNLEKLGVQVNSDLVV